MLIAMALRMHCTRTIGVQLAATLRALAAVLFAFSSASCDKLPNLPWMDSPSPDAKASSEREDELPGQASLIFLKDNVQVIAFRQSQLERKVRGEQIRVLDANERTQVAFEGAWVNSLLDSALGQDWQRSTYVEFRSEGGGSVAIATSRLAARRAWLAWGRADRRDFVIRIAADNGRAVSAGPLYLVWDTLANAPASDPDPWVMGIGALNLTNVAAVSAALGLPIDASPAARPGLVHFQAFCARCHSINGIGGGSGPELNAPFSVTQYWQAGWLEKFLDNPTAIRLGAASPKVPADVADRAKVISEIVAFLAEAARVRPTPVLP